MTRRRDRRRRCRPVQLADGSTALVQADGELSAYDIEVLEAAAEWLRTRCGKEVPAEGELAPRAQRISGRRYRTCNRDTNHEGDCSSYPPPKEQP